MKKIRTHEDLDVWKLSIEFITKIDKSRSTIIRQMKDLKKKILLKELVRLKKVNGKFYIENKWH